MNTFNHKVAAITGAGSGIGQQIAIELAKRGCHVALADIDMDSLQATEALVNEANSAVKVTRRQVNVAKLEEIEAWAEAVIQEHNQVNLIVNNAGVALGSTVEGASYADLEWIMGINFWGVVYGTKVFLPLLKKTGDGHIINMSSLFGLTAQPGQSGYNASKFAVRGFTESLRQELDLHNNGVSATCVHPGGVRTNIANNARTNTSLDSLGIDSKNSAKHFNRLLRASPTAAATEILEAVLRNERRLLIGNDAKAIDLMQRVLPTGYQKITSSALKHLTKLKG